MRASVGQVLEAPNENEIVRGARRAKTTCLMVSLVRKKGKHGRGSGALSDRIFLPSTTLSFSLFFSLSLRHSLSLNFLLPCH